MNATDLAKILDELGQRLGPTGQRVFELAIRQVYIDGVMAGLLLVIVAVVGIVGGPRLYRWSQGGSYGDRDIFLMIFGVCYALILFLAVINVLIAVPALLNPEYAALRDLLAKIRP